MEKGFGLMPGACKSGFSKELEGCERPGRHFPNSELGSVVVYYCRTYVKAVRGEGG